MKGRERCFAYLDIKVIGGQDELEESPLIHLNNSTMYKTNLFFHSMLDQVFIAEPLIP